MTNVLFTSGAMKARRELNALVAEKLFGISDIEWKMSGVLAPYSQTFGYQNPESEGWILDYSGEIEAASLVEDEIERRELQLEYASILINQVLLVPHGYTETLAWTVIRATPEQRCRAALKAIGVDI